jgi:hypothetical protein
MNKTIIFCESYGQVPRILQIISHHAGQRPVTLVIPGFKDLYEFFKSINDRVFHDRLETIFVEPFKPSRAKVAGIRKAFYVLPDILRERRFLKDIYARYFTGVTGAEILFLSRGYSGLKIYLLDKLSKSNRLEFYGVAYGPPVMEHYSPANLHDFLNLAIWKLTYGNEASLGMLPYNKGFIFTTNRFMDKKVSRVVEEAEIDEMMADYSPEPYKVYDAGNYDVIYFDDGLLEAGYVTNKDVYQQELDRVFSILARYFPAEKIAYKYHPGAQENRSFISTGTMLPSHIPAELLHNEHTKMYLSIFSRSIANLKQGLAVSIANLITFESETAKKGLKNDLIQASKSRVLFPESLDEFEQIVVELSNSVKTD